MGYWPFWMGGIALALVALLHWLLVGRLMSVSSRFTQVVDQLRGRTQPEPVAEHGLFLGGLVVGGAIAAAVRGQLVPTLLASPGVSFDRLFGTSPAALIVVLLVGGVLVGLGTRMATGCTSGHGLCGVARWEKGSLLATVAFFGTAVVVSLIAKVLS